jgi:hypothetical protein
VCNRASIGEHDLGAAPLVFERQVVAPLGQTFSVCYSYHRSHPLYYAARQWC